MPVFVWKSSVDLPLSVGQVGSNIPARNISQPGLVWEPWTISFGEIHRPGHGKCQIPCENSPYTHRHINCIMYVYIYIYIYACVCVWVCVCRYIYLSSYSDASDAHHEKHVEALNYPSQRLIHLLKGSWQHPRHRKLVLTTILHRPQLHPRGTSPAVKLMAYHPSS